MTGTNSKTETPSRQQFFGRMTAREFETAIAIAARKSARRLGLDPEDLAQDGALRVLEDSRRNTLRQADIERPANYLGTVVARLAASRVAGTTRSESFAAWREYRKQQAAQELDLGRELTLNENDRLAADIRLSMPAGRRPPEGFHRPIRVIPMPNEDLNEITPATLDLGSRLHDRLTPDGPLSRSQAKLLAWNALADIYRAPKVRPSSIGPKVAAKIRKEVAECGGPLRLAIDFQDGNVSELESAALFKVFGDIDASGCEGAVNLILRYQSPQPKLADALWDSAVTAATGRNRPPAVVHHGAAA